MEVSVIELGNLFELYYDIYREVIYYQSMADVEHFMANKSNTPSNLTSWA